MINLTLVIPCYNEKENLPLLIKNISKLDKNIKFTIIENGSSDDSKTYLQAEEKNLNSNISVFYIENNEGYGKGVYKGLLSVENSDFIGWLHGDLQFEFDKLNELISKLNDFSSKHEKVFYKGIRTGRSILERFISHFMGIIASKFLGYKFREINTQPTIFSKELIFEFNNPPNDFRFDTYVYWLAMKSGYIVFREHFDFPPREYGNSKWNFGIKSRLIFSYNLIKYFNYLKKI